MFMPLARRLNMLDIPNERSSHTVTKYRGGGLVFSVVWFVTLAYLRVEGALPVSIWLALFVPGFLVAFTGFIDDLVSLSSKLRFGIYLLASLVLMVASFWGGKQACYWLILEAVVFILATTWSINLFNFMDGTDGIASTQMLAILILAMAAFTHVGAIGVAYSAASLFVAILVFLFFNWPPAKLFMGDVGSATLGVVVAAYALIGFAEYHISLIPWLIVYCLFWFDATVTLIRRLKAGHPWSQAHKFHAYQRLHQSGLSHAGVLYWAILLYALLEALALLALFYPVYQWLLLAVALLLLITAYVIVEKRKPLKVESST